MQKSFSQINKILSFYKSLPDEAAIYSGIFSEGNNDNMIWNRLERAAKDEASNDLLHSRYTIFANDVKNILDKAVFEIENGDVKQGIKALHMAAKAMSAFKDIQALFDSVSFGLCTTADIFYPYVKYLLSKEDRSSQILNKDEILTKLKAKCNANIGLPKGIDFIIKNGVLKVWLDDVSENMQNNGASFESWIIILYAWLPEIIQYVVLDFQEPCKYAFGTPANCHYNRFLYCLSNFSRLFPEWFFIEENKRDIVNEFIRFLKTGKYLLNHSLTERVSVIETEKIERQIESWFVFEKGKELLCNHYHIDKDKLFNQIPIGIFKDEIAAKNAVFTRGASAIDIVGISGCDTLHIIELKCGNNIKVGVISEILFYTAVMYDTCVCGDNLFEFGHYANTTFTSDAVAIQNGGVKFKKLCSHILSERYHPLLSNEVIELIQSGLSTLNIYFDKATYSYKKQVIFDEVDNV